MRPVDPLITSAILLGLQLVIVLGFVLVERREPQATLAWVLAVVFIPVIGAFLYLVFGLGRTVRRIRLGQRVARLTRTAFARWHVGRKARGQNVLTLDARIRPIVQLAERVAQARACTGNAVEMLVDARATYDAMRSAIALAEQHVHVEFYIIQPDSTGESLRSLLVARARDGLRVRVLCDGVGCLKLPDDFWEPLVQAGGQVGWFSPLRLAPIFRSPHRMNFRNHRKNVVVDGVVGFTGGINIGREYLGLDPEIGDWRDTHVEIRGPAVIDLQKTFVEDWLAATGELLDDDGLFPELEGPAGDGVVQIVASGPDRPWSVIQQLFVLAIARAEQRVWITSPYFIPDAVVKNALMTAALAGQDVRVLVPERSDSRLVDLASRHHFSELLRAGVRIHTYRAGFLHAKTMVIDDWLGVIGSTNMDVRSFQLNYELTAFIYDRLIVEELAAVFEADMLHAPELPSTWDRDLRYGRRLLHACAGLMSPLL